MIKINLLPHRAEKRRVQLMQFIALSSMSFVVGLLVVGLVHIAISAQVGYQERRNNFLNAQVAVLNRQISEIKKLREQTQYLMARKNVVENLQSTRSDVVHLLDQLLRTLPDDVYLKSIKQNDNKISMVGLAQSNARVSTLMRSIEDSDWLDTPVLVEIHVANNPGPRLSEFSLNFNLTKQAPTQPPAVIKPLNSKS